MKVVGVHWNDGSCTQVIVLSKRTGRTFVVEFDSVVGLRLLDELDLAGVWLSADKHALGSSWLFEVSTGRWLELESGRDDFNTKHQAIGLHEFMIAGHQECVSIFSASYPNVFESHGS